MDTLGYIRRLAEHCRAVDAALLEALRSDAVPPPAAVREYAHILGAEEVWLARLEGRDARTAVWPDATAMDELVSLRQAVADAYRVYLGRLAAAELMRSVNYRNSAGLAFENSVADILLHVMLHGQYHRGRVNLLLRQGGMAPEPADYIAFVRGVRAATSEDAARENAARQDSEEPRTG